MAQSTVVTSVSIDVSPEGISLTFEGIDSDLANLMFSGKQYVCESKPAYRTYDTSDVVIKTRKALQFVEPVVIESATSEIDTTSP